MTCFWDGILRGLKADDFEYIREKKSSRENFINMLKNHCKKSVDNNKDYILWNNGILSKKEWEEHDEAINCYNVAGIRSGHLTSTCDSFLLFICYLFDISIVHRYMNTSIHYINKSKSRKTLKFSSNRGHFVFLR